MSSCSSSFPWLPPDAEHLVGSHLVWAEDARLKRRSIENNTHPQLQAASTGATDDIPSPRLPPPKCRSRDSRLPRPVQSHSRLTPAQHATPSPSSPVKDLQPRSTARMDGDGALVATAEGGPTHDEVERRLHDHHQSALHPCRANFQPINYSAGSALAGLAIVQAGGITSSAPNTIANPSQVRLEEGHHDKGRPSTASSEPLIRDGPLEGTSMPFSPEALWSISNAKYTVETPHLQPTPTNSIPHTPRAARASVEGMIALQISPQPSAYSSLSEGTATLFPGESHIFERPLYFTRSFHTFDDMRRQRCLLRIFLNTATKVLRFTLTAGLFNQQSFEIHSKTHELVIAHAYTTDPAWENVLYIQRKPLRDSAGSRTICPSQRNIVFMCRFDNTEDIADFQKALLGETLVLDVSSVRSVRCRWRKETIEISNCRLQIWHEDRSSPSMRSDEVSLPADISKPVSGPKVEWTRPRYTRIVIFLGRREEYITFVITDDVRMSPISDNTDGYHLSILIQPRSQHGSLAWPGRYRTRPFTVWHARSNSHAAGFLLGGPSLDIEDDSSAHGCQGLGIEFEDRIGYNDFMDIWAQAIQFRRESKAVLMEIERRMGREQFTARQARSMILC